MDRAKALQLIGQVCGHAMAAGTLQTQQNIAEAFLVVTTAPEQPPPKSETVEAE